MKVLKFGGTSMADAHTVSHVFDIIKKSAENRFIVVSAPGKSLKYTQKVTDSFSECCALAREGRDFSAKFKEIADRFLNIGKELGVKINLSSELKIIEHKLSRGADYDYVISRGEYLTAKILAALLKFEFIDAAEFIRFDTYGKLNLPLTAAVADKRLKTSRGAVIPGFYGVMPSGAIKTFSRGGSDITGAIVAYAVKAGVYENWTDVDGFYRCDPKIVPDCGIVEVITYDELCELSYMGAGVLHPEAVYPTMLGDIPIHLRNTFNPDAKGTMIVSSLFEADRINADTITGIAGKSGFLGVLIEKTMMNSEIGFVCGVLKIFEKYGVSIEHLPTGIDSLTVVIDKKNIESESLGHIILEITAVFSPDNIRIIDDLSLIAIAGQNMRGGQDSLYRICKGLSKENINIRFINKTTNDLSVIVGVEELQCERAIKAIYSEFYPDS